MAGFVTPAKQLDASLSFERDFRSFMDRFGKPQKTKRPDPSLSETGQVTHQLSQPRLAQITSSIAPASLSPSASPSPAAGSVSMSFAAVKKPTAFRKLTDNPTFSPLSRPQGSPVSESQSATPSPSPTLPESSPSPQSSSPSLPEGSPPPQSPSPSFFGGFSFSGSISKSPSTTPEGHSIGKGRSGFSSVRSLSPSSPIPKMDFGAANRQAPAKSPAPAKKQPELTVLTPRTPLAEIHGLFSNTAELYDTPPTSPVDKSPKSSTQEQSDQRTSSAQDAEKEKDLELVEDDNVDQTTRQSPPLVQVSGGAGVGEISEVQEAEETEENQAQASSLSIPQETDQGETLSDTLEQEKEVQVPPVAFNPIDENKTPSAPRTTSPSKALTGQVTVARTLQQSQGSLQRKAVTELMKSFLKRSKGGPAHHSGCWVASKPCSLVQVVSRAPDVTIIVDINYYLQLFDLLISAMGKYIPADEPLHLRADELHSVQFFSVLKKFDSKDFDSDQYIFFRAICDLFFDFCKRPPPRGKFLKERLEIGYYPFGKSHLQATTLTNVVARFIPELQKFLSSAYTPSAELGSLAPQIEDGEWDERIAAEISDEDASDDEAAIDRFEEEAEADIVAAVLETPFNKMYPHPSDEVIRARNKRNMALASSMAKAQSGSASKAREPIFEPALSHDEEVARRTALRLHRHFVRDADITAVLKADLDRSLEKTSQVAGDILLDLFQDIFQDQEVLQRLKQKAAVSSKALS